MNKRFVIGTALLASLGMTSVTQAESEFLSGPPENLPPVPSVPSNSFDVSQCSVQNPSACLNGVSGVVTSLDTLRVFLTRPVNPQGEQDKRDRRASLRPVLVAASGDIAALGAPASGWGLWASGSRARFEGTVPVAPYKAEIDMVSLGVDRLIASRLLLGAALAEERVDTRTFYNAGGQDGEATTLTAYASYLVSDAVSVDMTLGRGWGETTQARLDPTSPVGIPLIVRGSYDSDRTLWSLVMNASRQIGPWGFGGRVGYLHAREEQDGYRETGGPSARIVADRTVSLGQAFLGVDGSYGINRNWQLHGAAIYRRDTSRNEGRSGGGLPTAVGAVQPDDRDEIEWIVGLRFYGGRRFTMNLEYLNTAGRDRFKNESLSLIGRIDF